MQKLSGLEKTTIALTLLFLLGLFGWFFLSNQTRGVVWVEREALPSAVAALPEEVAAPGILPGEHINLNTADEEDLDRLPGIGAKRAENIVQYRQEHGGFQTVDELLEIDGIGEGILEQLRDYVTLTEEGVTNAENFGGG